MRVNQVPTTYKTLTDFLGTKSSRKLCNNTWAIQHGDLSIDIILHSTPIVTLKANGNYVLRMRMWDTVTTRNRINMFLPYKYRLVRRKGITRLAFRTFDKNNKVCYIDQGPFIEGTELTA